MFEIGESTVSNDELNKNPKSVELFDKQRFSSHSNNMISIESLAIREESTKKVNVII